MKKILILAASFVVFFVAFSLNKVDASTDISGTMNKYFSEHSAIYGSEYESYESYIDQDGQEILEKIPTKSEVEATIESYHKKIGLSTAEIMLCIMYPNIGIKYLIVSENLRRESTGNYYNNKYYSIFESRMKDDGSIGNAFLHAFWSALLVKELGKYYEFKPRIQITLPGLVFFKYERVVYENITFAEKFTNAHENYSGNTVIHSTMDLHNNKTAINHAVKNLGLLGKTSLSGDQIADSIVNELIVKEKLVYISSIKRTDTFSKCNGEFIKSIYMGGNDANSLGVIYTKHKDSYNKFFIKIYWVNAISDVSNEYIEQHIWEKIGNTVRCYGCGYVNIFGEIWM